MSVTVSILKVGYSNLDLKSNVMKANCTCTLIQDGKNKVIVDTLTAWDSHYLIEGKVFFILSLNFKGYLVTVNK